MRVSFLSPVCQNQLESNSYENEKWKKFLSINSLKTGQSTEQKGIF